MSMLMEKPKSTAKAKAAEVMDEHDPFYTLPATVYNPNDTASVTPEGATPDAALATNFIAVGTNVDDINSPATTSTTNTLASLGSASEQVSAAASPATTIDSAPGSLMHVTVNGVKYSVEKLEHMKAAVAAARAAGGLPRTRADTNDPAVVVEDYGMLARLRRFGLEWPQSEEYNVAYVDAARRIQERDERLAEQSRRGDQQVRLNHMVTEANGNEQVYTTVYNAVRAAFQHNSVSAPTAGGADLRTLARVVQNSMARVMHNSVARAGVDTQAITQAVEGAVANTIGRDGVTGVNMEAVTEEVMGVIERSILDATGPMRLNTSRMDSLIDDHRTLMQGLRQDQRTLTQDQRTLTQDQRTLTQDQRTLTQDQRTLMQGQREAINGQVSALGGHMTALSSHMTALSSHMSALSGSMTRMDSNVNSVRTTVEDIPALITREVQQALERLLPALAQTIMVPLIISIAHHKNSIGLSSNDSLVTHSNHIPEGHNGKPKKENWLKRAWKKLFGRPDGESNMNC